MTTQPPAPDWYPDPSGKPGPMYWDGHQWHKDGPTTPPQPDREPAQSISTTRQSNGRIAMITALWLIVVVVAGTVAIVGYLILKQAHRSQVSTAQPRTVSSVPTVQPAPPSGPNQAPAPQSGTTAIPSPQYVKTPWGTRCQVGTDEIICDTCEPGLLLDTPAGADCPGPSLNEIAVDSSGTSHSPAAGVILPTSPGIQQLSDGQTYHVNGWTIAVSRWVRFTNDATGHGMAVAAQNRDFF